MGLTCDETWQADGVANLQMRDRFLVLNSILSERITVAAAPLYQNIPCGNLTGYTVDIRVLPLAIAGVCKVSVSSGILVKHSAQSNALHVTSLERHHMKASRLG